MKIGYPCINRSIGCTANSTFRLANYSEERLVGAVENNLDCLEKILRFNADNGLLFFRISSDLIPFASHPVCRFKWQDHFSLRFKEIGRLIKRNRIRISMHPDQFVLINAKDRKIVESSIREIEYHVQVLDLLGLDASAKIQIHAGGVYGDKAAAAARFVESYNKLTTPVRKCLVIENDHRLFSLKDCLEINRLCGIPVLFDVFHHKCLNRGEPVREALLSAGRTWNKEDGVLMVDYSTQKRGAPKGTHADHVSEKDLGSFLKEARGIEFDLMLEIKDKEKSALSARRMIFK